MTLSQQAPLVERLNDPIAHDRETTVQLICRWRTERKEAAARIAELEGDLKAAFREISKLAREAGEAIGRLEMSEAAGVVDGWRERAEAAEANSARLEEALRPFAQIVPSSLFPADGSEGEVYELFLTDDPCAPISGADLARARAALIARAQEGESDKVWPIDVEKMLCAALNKTWSPTGMSIVTLVAELKSRVQEGEEKGLIDADEKLSAWLRMMSHDGNVHPADQKRLLEASQRLAAPFSGISREVREALEFYAANWDWYPGDGEYNGIEPGSPPTYYEAEPNAALKDDGGEKARKALSTLTAGASNTEGGEDEDENDPQQPCATCGEYHPAGVLEDGLCPLCVDDDDEANA